ncbi:MAG: hypothetical protein ACI4EQ_02990 [Lachnospiraceae bacterium]
MKSKKLILSGFIGVVLLTTVIKWNYLIYFLNIVVQAAEQLVSQEAVSEEFQYEMDTLSIDKFIDIPFVNEYLSQKKVTNESQDNVTLEEIVDSILEE